MKRTVQNLDIHRYNSLKINNHSKEDEELSAFIENLNDEDQKKVKYDSKKKI